MANMADRIYNRFIVIKNSDIDKYLTGDEKESLSIALVAIANGRARDGKAPENTYLVCNTDEPYADKVLDIILDGEDRKGKSEKYTVIEMIGYDGEPVPKELCTIGRDEIADDFMGCGNCFDSDGGADCSDCVIDKMFKHYAVLTNQN